MKAKSLQWLGIILILEIGMIHIFSAQQAYEGATWMGYLFATNFLGSLLAAYAIYRRWVWGWGLGIVISAGSIVGYVWSRTLGFPGMETESWFSPFGLTTMVAAILFLVVMALRPWKEAQSTADTVKSTWQRLVLPAIGVLILLVTTLSVYRWQNITHESAGIPYTSAEQVHRLNVISSSELEQQYGIQIHQVAISALESIVDVRLKIIDEDKAHLLLDYDTALLVDDQSLILAPTKHSHDRLKPGLIYVMFFPTQNRTVKTGSQVSLVFGDVRVEPVTAR